MFGLMGDGLMHRTIGRRTFLTAIGTAAAASAVADRHGDSPGTTPKGKIVLKPFDYRSVSLGASRWQRQFQSARDYYLSVPDDNILYGFRRAPIDRQHPDRVAVVRGPVVYAQQIVHKHLVRIPKDDGALNRWMVPGKDPMVFQYAGQEQSSQRDDFVRYYRFGEMESYRMYFDPGLRNTLW